MAQDVLASTMTEDQLLNAILDMAARFGWLRYHVRNSKRGVIQGTVGFPDLVLARGRRVIFAELKDAKGKPSKDQWRWITTLGDSPAELYLWRPADWLSGAIERVLL